MGMPRILIVDDQPFMRDTLRQMLTALGHEVVAEGGDGLVAQQLYKDLAPDAVTLDISMPRMDGLDALAGIMDMDSDARIVMCSAFGQQEVVVEAIRRGAKEFVVKPFDATRVRDAIDYAIGGLDSNRLPAPHVVAALDTAPPQARKASSFFA